MNKDSFKTNKTKNIHKIKSTATPELHWKNYQYEENGHRSKEW